jgi:hypothetical protein
MEKRALVLALALTLPLALYGIPYAYAATTQSTYVVRGFLSIPANGNNSIALRCSSPSDSTLHFAAAGGTAGVSVTEAIWLNSFGNAPATGDIPNGWEIFMHNPNNGIDDTTVWIACQSPITVAGIGVPQFGSLYVAIALGAILYFLLSRRFARGPTTAQNHLQ